MREKASALSRNLHESNLESKASRFVPSGLNFDLLFGAFVARDYCKSSNISLGGLIHFRYFELKLQYLNKFILLTDMGPYYEFFAL